MGSNPSWWRGVNSILTRLMQIVRAGQDYSTKFRIRRDPEFASCVNPGDELLISSSTTNWDDDKKVSIASVDPISGVVGIETPILDVLPGVEKTVIYCHSLLFQWYVF